MSRGGYTVLYLSLLDFYAEYAEAEVKTAQLDLMKKYQKIKMLILDEFLLIPILLEFCEEIFAQFGRNVKEVHGSWALRCCVAISLRIILNCRYHPGCIELLHQLRHFGIILV